MSVWTTLQSFLPDGIKDKLYLRSSMASMFTASLELVKQGALEVKQDGAFRPIYMRERPPEMHGAVNEDDQETGDVV